ncbi:uncharacterized protein BXIN_0072 [Babesia sp. Xinjiang]|uniref:uncharacterized protein n=1 Tax=Babesia sp. Xinjiang TaxID=462227 RepID=UPI000A24E705|nr:uncharacterized protein BXIN_0072 [Babesia sp. Xinjiang]ORM39687.1 hypothetical protein BXIN_0072 [Babesia sp. Xinjiang]
MVLKRLPSSLFWPTLLTFLKLVAMLVRAENDELAVATDGEEGGPAVEVIEQIPGVLCWPKSFGNISRGEKTFASISIVLVTILFTLTVLAVGSDKVICFIIPGLLILTTGGLFLLHDLITMTVKITKEEIIAVFAMVLLACWLGSYLTACGCGIKCYEYEKCETICKTDKHRQGIWLPIFSIILLLVFVAYACYLDAVDPSWVVSEVTLFTFALLVLLSIVGLGTVGCGAYTMTYAKQELHKSIALECGFSPVLTALFLICAYCLGIKYATVNLTRIIYGIICVLLFLGFVALLVDNVTYDMQNTPRFAKYVLPALGVIDLMLALFMIYFTLRIGVFEPESVNRYKSVTVGSCIIVGVLLLFTVIRCCVCGEGGKAGCTKGTVCNIFLAIFLGIAVFIAAFYGFYTYNSLTHEQRLRMSYLEYLA